MEDDVDSRFSRTVESARHRVIAYLEKNGFLLFTDPRFDSVVSLVAGSPVRGSWWGHPAGSLIYSVGEELEGSRRVLTVPLYFGKRTLIDRPWWSDVLAIGKERTRWQIEDLSAPARELLRLVDRRGAVRCDVLDPSSWGGRPTGDVARELEGKLLVVGTSVHLAGGEHAKLVTSWPRWKEDRRFQGKIPGARPATARIEERAQRLFPAVPLARIVPWRRSRRPNHPRGRDGSRIVRKRPET